MWDAIVIGGGIIGLSLARELRRLGDRVLVIERGEPGHEASHAAAGMIAPSFGHSPPALDPLAAASAAMYAEFAQEIEDESGEHVDYRARGSLLLPAADEDMPPLPELTREEVARLEPRLAAEGRPIYLLEREASVDPRRVMTALTKAVRHRGIDIASGTAVLEVAVEGGRAAGVRTAKSAYRAPLVINCAGAWSGQIAPHTFPTKPIKGQMLAVVPAEHHPGDPPLVRHVVRAPEVYVVPRSDGRLLVGSTLEDAGFDKRTDAATIQRLQQAATALIPELGRCRQLEAWAGLRPGTPDDLPLLGATPTPGYFAAVGHYANGILLAPATARCMAELVHGRKPEIDLSPFSPERFVT